MRKLLVVISTLALWCVALAAGAQERSASGVVVDQATGEPIAGASISYEGVEAPGAAGDDGSFTMALPAEGAVTLEVSAQGYETLSVEWTEGSELRVELVRTAAAAVTPTPEPEPTPEEPAPTPTPAAAADEESTEYAEQLVVVGRSTSLRRKHMSSAVATVDGDSVARGNPQTLSEALQGKVVGANIQANSGAPGGGIQLSLRGVSTINGQSAPLYVVDGVIVSDVAVASGISAVTSSTSGSNSASTQDNQVNRIADLNPHDIASVQVLKGASAAAIYGSKASNGVVIINTKRGGGKEGVKGSITQRVGVYQLSNTLGSRNFETEQEAVDAFGPTASQHWQPGVSYDHEAELSKVRDPSFETIGSVSGRAGSTDYYASILSRDDKGIIANTGYQKQGGRVSIGHSFGTRLRLQASTSVIHSVARRSMTNNDNAGVSHYMVFPFTPNFLNLNQNADGTYPSNPFIGSGTNPFQTAALMSDSEDVWRLVGSARADLTLFENGPHWGRMNVNLGVDQFQQANDLLFPPELFFEPDDSLPGTALRTTSDSQNVNYGINGLYTFYPEDASFEATTSFGLQEESRELDSVYIVSRNLTAGQGNVDAGTQIDITQNRQLVRDRGFYVQEDLLLMRERLALIGALRFEQSSNNGDPSQLYLYPKAGAAFLLPWLPPKVTQLKARIAYGETGNQPLYGQKFTSLDGTRTIEGIPTVVNTGVTGDPDIRPERQREIEGGVDIVAFKGRVVLEATAYQRTISDLLLQRAVAPSTGFTTEFFNGGELRNRGVELMLQAEPISNDEILWVSRTGFSMNRSEITDLPVPAFLTGGFGTALGAFRIEEGKSATQIVGNAGLNPDGSCCVVIVLGDTEPDFRVSFFNSVGWRDLTFSFLADWQQGSEVINLTKLLYDLGQNTADFEGAGQERLANWPTFASPYIEDASFLKVREVALSYRIPSKLTGRIPAVDSITATLSGRNLLTFTNYSGLDPEVSNFGNQPIARNIDVAPFPPSRSYWISMSVGF